MFKKIASLVLAATMMVGTAAFSASAAEADAEAVSADDSSAVGADSSSEVGAEDSSAVGAGSEVYFDVKASNWNNVKQVFCHIWRADGTGDWPAWQTKKELCKYDSATGIATYDLSKTGNDIKSSDGNVYCVIFSANTGMQTYNTIMSGGCIGDTLYCNGEMIENPEDSEKKAAVAVWKKNPNCGPEKKITSTGNIVGTAYPDGETDTTLLAQYLIQYYNQTAKTDLTQNLLDTLKVSPYDVLAVVKARLGDDPDGKLPYIEKVLTSCKDPNTGEAVDKEKLDNVQANSSAGSSGSSSSSNSGSSSSSSSSSSGSSSVKSGQETTIFFVFGGLMLAAAGMTFLARKKREE
ncbi:MAG: LPXTG cell wall anchor domain-containing protein [Ruminococcus sp.]|nr:LPXTG cell wall anchor domain-containing protein [Ruminococcus sp.]